MNYNDFMEIVAMGEEFDFIFEGEQYWISHNHDGYYLSRCSDSYTQEFKTSDDLFRNARVNGKSIIELWGVLRSNFETYELPIGMNRDTFRRLPAE